MVALYLVVAYFVQGFVVLRDVVVERPEGAVVVEHVKYARIRPVVVS